jgi:hypothetical protein
MEEEMVADLILENPSIMFDTDSEFSIINEMVENIKSRIFEDQTFDINKEENPLELYIVYLFEADLDDKEEIEYYVNNFESEIIDLDGLERADYTWDDVYSHLISKFVDLFKLIGLNLNLENGNIHFREIYYTYSNLIKDIVLTCRKAVMSAEKQRNDKLSANDLLLDEAFSIQDEFLQLVSDYDQEISIMNMVDLVEDLDITFDDMKFKDYLQIIISKVVI